MQKCPGYHSDNSLKTHQAEFESTGIYIYTLLAFRAEGFNVIVYDMMIVQYLLIYTTCTCIYECTDT